MIFVLSLVLLSSFFMIFFFCFTFCVRLIFYSTKSEKSVSTNSLASPPNSSSNGAGCMVTQLLPLKLADKKVSPNDNGVYCSVFDSCASFVFFYLFHSYEWNRKFN